MNGLGVFSGSKKKIYKGSFVGIMAGELIKASCAEIREQ